MNPSYAISDSSSRAAAHADERVVLAGGLFTKDRDFDLAYVRPFFEKCYKASSASSLECVAFKDRIERNCLSNIDLLEESLEMMATLSNVDREVIGDVVALAENMTLQQRYRLIKFVTDNQGILMEVRAEDDCQSLSMKEYLGTKVREGNRSQGRNGKKTTSLEAGVRKNTVKAKYTFGFIIALIFSVGIAFLLSWF